MKNEFDHDSGRLNDARPAHFNEAQPTPFAAPSPFTKSSVFATTSLRSNAGRRPWGAMLLVGALALGTVGVGFAQKMKPSLPAPPALPAPLTGAPRPDAPRPDASRPDAPRPDAPPTPDNGDALPPAPRGAEAPRPGGDARPGEAPRGEAPRPGEAPRGSEALRPGDAPRRGEAPRPDDGPRGAKGAQSPQRGRAPRPGEDARMGGAPRPGGNARPGGAPRGEAPRPGEGPQPGQGPEGRGPRPVPADAGTQGGATRALQEAYRAAGEVGTSQGDGRDIDAAARTFYARATQALNAKNYSQAFALADISGRLSRSARALSTGDEAAPASVPGLTPPPAAAAPADDSAVAARELNRNYNEWNRSADTDNVLSNRYRALSETNYRAALQAYNAKRFTEAARRARQGAEQSRAAQDYADALAL